MKPTAPAVPTGKKQRPCPALNGPISAADCGRQRGSRFTCPADCPFFPFAPAGYELWTRVDIEWSRKALDRVVQVWGRERLQAALKALELPLEPDSVRWRTALDLALHQLLFLETGPEGQTAATAWEAAGWAGLNNDEQVMMRHRRHTRLAALEVQRVADARSLLCTDLLDPARPPFWVLDPGLAPAVVRFSRLLTRLTHYPHFAAPSLPTLEIPHALWTGWWEGVHARAAAAEHGTTPAELSPETVRAHLEAHLRESLELLNQLSREHRIQTLEQLGLYQCLARFQLNEPAAAVESVLRQHPALRPADLSPLPTLGAPLAGFAWWEGPPAAPRPADPAPASNPPPPVGWFRLYPGFLVVETATRARHAQAIEFVGRAFPTQARFWDDVQLDLARVFTAAQQREALVHAAENAIFGEAESAPPAVPVDSASPPSPTPEQIRAEHDARYRRLLDQPLPELGGLTPRQAVRDPTRRPQVVALFKTHLHNLERRNRRELVPLSMDWVIEALELVELK